MKILFLIKEMTMEEKIWSWEFDPLTARLNQKVILTRGGFPIAETETVSNASRMVKMLNFAEENMSKEEINKDV